MDKHLLRGVPAPISLAESDKAPEEIQLLRAGVFHHPWSGPFTIDSELIGTMVENFKLNVRRMDLALDYSHENWSEAAAWFSDIFSKNNGTELWGKPKWTPKGREKVENKEFRYISAEFDPDYKDDETGKKYGPTLFGAALTNRPFIKGMSPAVGLSETVTTNGGYAMNKELEALQAENKALTERIAAMTTENNTLKASEKSRQGLEDQVRTLSEENKTLKEFKVKAEADRAKLEKESTFNKLLSEGKVCEAQRESYLAGDMVKFAELQAPVKLHQSGNPGQGSNGGTKLSEEEAEALMDKEVKKKLSEGMDHRRAVIAVRKEFPAIAEALG